MYIRYMFFSYTSPLYSTQFLKEVKTCTSLNKAEKHGAKYDNLHSA